MIEFQCDMRNLIDKKTTAGLQNGGCREAILEEFNRFGPHMMNAALETVKACDA